MIVCQPFFCYRGTSFSVYQRTRIMAEKGVEVDLLTYGQGEDVAIPGVNIIRIPKVFGDVKIGPSFKKAFLDIFMFIWMVVLLIKRRYDFVHAHEEGAFFCLFLKKIFRFKWVYDMHSCLSQQLTNFKFTKSRLLIGIFEKLEKACLESADAVITICPDLKSVALSMMPSEEKHFLIENSLFETEFFQIPLDVELPKNKKLIVYAGTFESYQGIDLLLSSFKMLKCKDAHLILIGGTVPQVEAYKKIASEDCTIYPRMGQSQVREIINRCALQISPRISGTNTPLKNYEQLANGIPLVATKIYSHTQILNEDVCFLVETEPKSLAEVLERALNHPELGREKVKNAQSLYNRKYSRAVYEQKIDNFLGVMYAE